MPHPGRNNIYEATIKRMVNQAIEAQEQAFLLDHSSDTDEQLLEYLCRCAQQLQHTPWPREIVGGVLIRQRFGTWENALRKARLPMPEMPDKVSCFIRFREETERQKILYTTAYALFTPTGDHAQYAICSPIVDAYGTVYYKNDSACLMAFGSTIERIEVTSNPQKMVYAEGESFDPQGMVVTATYANGTTRDVTKYVTVSADPITAENPVVTIAFPYVLYHNTEDGTQMQSGIQSTTPVTTLQVSVSGGEQLLGDVNADGQIDILDANLVISCYYETITLNAAQLAAGDVNGDGEVDTVDAGLIISFFYGDITTFETQ